MTEKNYGHTETGKPITDDLVGDLVEEAVRGYDVDTLATRRRGRGRPPLSAAAKIVESVRLEPALQSAAEQRAADDGVTVSEVVRRALREYLHTAKHNQQVSWRRPSTGTLTHVAGDDAAMVRLIAEAQAHVSPMRLAPRRLGDGFVCDLVGRGGSVIQADYATGPNELIAILAAEQRYLVEQVGNDSVVGATYLAKARERVRRAQDSA